MESLRDAEFILSKLSLTYYCADCAPALKQAMSAEVRDRGKPREQRSQGGAKVSGSAGGVLESMNSEEALPFTE